MGVPVGPMLGPMLSLSFFGQVEVRQGEATVALPSSKKTRALLGFLVLSGAPQRRDRLCELFWHLPDDPRGSLRWSLSKLRGAVNIAGEPLKADRERVTFEPDGVAADVFSFRQIADTDALSAAEMAAAWAMSGDPLMADCDLPDHAGYTAWLEDERRRVAAARAQLARRLAGCEDLGLTQRIQWADRWRDLAPHAPAAGPLAVSLRRQAGLAAQADRLESDLSGRATPPSRLDPDPLAGADLGASVEDAPRVPQRVHFVVGGDGANLAWAAIGADKNPPLIKAANWLTHLELDWEAPIWSPLFRQLGQSFQLVRYDERGCGLSDWEVAEISFATFVRDLEIVADAAGHARFPLLGISQGAAVSIEYAVRHPDRVSHLVLFGGYAAGWRATAEPEEVAEREAIMVLTKSGWGRSDPAYRRLFSQTFMPGATQAELAWFDEFQRRTTSPENAVRFLQSFSLIDVRDRLAEVKVPTLVLHSRDDKRIPFEQGRALATGIRGAEFVGLDSDNHLLIGREPASAAFVAAVKDFVLS